MIVAVNGAPLNWVSVGSQFGVPLVHPETVAFHPSMLASSVKARGLLAAGWITAPTFCNPKLAVNVPAINNTTRRLAVFKEYSSHLIRIRAFPQKILRTNPSREALYTFS